MNNAVVAEIVSRLTDAVWAVAGDQGSRQN
jgi:hypothetical protein